MNDPASIDLFSSPAFWVVVAIMLYAAGTFFPFIYASGNFEKEDFLSTYDLIHDTLYIVKNVIFSFAMVIKNKTGKTNSYTVPKKKLIKP